MALTFCFLRWSIPMVLWASLFTNFRRKSIGGFCERRPRWLNANYRHSSCGGSNARTNDFKDVQDLKNSWMTNDKYTNAWHKIIMTDIKSALLTSGLLWLVSFGKYLASDHQAFQWISKTLWIKMRKRSWKRALDYQRIFLSLNDDAYWLITLNGL